MSHDRITLDGAVTSDEPAYVPLFAPRGSRSIVFAACLLFGCSGGGDGDTGGTSGNASAAPGTESQEPTTPAAEKRWQYLPTLRKFVPAGVTARPFLEAVGGRTGQLWILTVSHGAGEPRVELWDFHTPEGQDVVTLREGPLPILRVNPGDKHLERLDELRRSIATPGTRRNRLAGLVVDGADTEAQARDLLQKLVGHAKTFRDPGASADDRADALLGLVQGLDDGIVLERDQLGSTIDLLVEMGEPTEVKAGRKIVRISVPSGEEALELELIAKGDGWVVMSAA